MASGIKAHENAVKSNLKLVTLELRGKPPAIIFEDADLDRALEGCSTGFLFNSGSVCVATSRCYVAEHVAGRFIHELKERFELLGEVLGADPKAPSTVLGPVIDEKQVERILQMAKKGKQTATLITGGTRKGSNGCFVLSTIFCRSTTRQRCLQRGLWPGLGGEDVQI